MLHHVIDFSAKGANSAPVPRCNGLEVWTSYNGKEII